MSTAENVMFFGGLVFVWGYPLAFFVLGGLWLLLGLYLLLTAGFFATLNMFLCSQSMNFACPLNGVPDPVRVVFFARNPSIARAWNDK
jgi:hypothetical protein